MGLDMYLSKRIHVGANYEHNKVTGTIDLYKNDKKININLNKVSEIIEHVGYWRKANAVHQWFVSNVQDGQDECKEYYVDSESLNDLLTICKRIKEECPLINGEVVNGQRLINGEWVNEIEQGKIMTNPEVAKTLLPTTSGFFFGGTDYDQWYMNDIDKTIEILESALEDKTGDFYYRASW